MTLDACFASNEDNANLYWRKDDKISVQTKSKTASFSNTVFSMKDGIETGKTNATFQGELASESTLGKYVAYPYNEKHQFTGEAALTYNLPASYTYTTVGGEVAEGAYPVNSTNIPLFGTIDTESKMITCHRLGGLMVVTIDKMPDASGTLTITADQQLSGNFSVDLSASDPMLATAATETEADKTVTFTFSGATKDGVGVFYLPLATGSYSNVKIGVKCGDTNSTVDYGALDVALTGSTSIPLYNNDGKIEKDEDGKLNGHKFVDLGLSVLWAETNIGAETAYGYGNYYAWGEVTAYDEETDWGTKDKKTAYSWDTYKYGTKENLTKYNSDDSQTVIDKEDDAAYVNWGSSWRMPTKEEFAELANSDNCTWEWTTVDGVNGYKVTSKKEGYTSNSIFLPASGYHDRYGFRSQGSTGVYWACSLVSSVPSYASCLNIYNEGVRCTDNIRYYGQSVRPVAAKPTK